MQMHTKSMEYCTFCSKFALCDVLQMHKWEGLITPQMGSGGGVVGIIIVFVCGDYGMVHVVKPFAWRCDATRTIAPKSR